jgi:YHS domain-containing protein
MVFAVVAAFSVAEDKKEFKATCIVAGKPAKETVSAEHKEGKVYFCCAMCCAAFKKDPSKFEAKANHQLYSTGQAKLAKCPFSGGKLNTATAIDVGGTKVCFCCEKCQAKAEAKTGDDRISLIFGDTTFSKGFEVKK